MAQNPNQRRAAETVAAWLAKNHKNPAWLVDATKADPGTIGDFLNHERWPKIGTQGRIEDALGWPAGIIRQIGNGSDVPDTLVTSASPAPPAPPGAVGGHQQDAGYVAAPGETVEGRTSNDEVLAGIREMREDMQELLTQVKRVADHLESGS